jgi:predicted RNA binding protein YcfA (HicA-like mRNA interferase family)
MPKPRVLHPARVVRALRRLGFRVERQKGSHLQLIRGDRLVTVPMHAGDLNRSVLASILRQAGISVSDLREAV